MAWGVNRMVISRQIRIFILILAFLSISAVTKQDLRKRYGNPIYETYSTDAGKIDAPYGSAELQKKYGEPISETYLIQKGIIGTARYKPNGWLRELIIAPQPPYQHNSARETIPYDTVFTIFDDIVPQWERGRGVRSAMYHVVAGNNEVVPTSSTEYEFLSITIYAGGEMRWYAEIQWK